MTQRSIFPPSRFLPSSPARRPARSAPRRPAALVVGIGALLATGCVPGSFVITPISGGRSLQEFELRRESFWAHDKIALLDVDGVISNARSSSLLGQEGENPVSLFKEKLDRAAKDDDVRAVVLRINSPGGGVTASDLMHAELRRFREKTGKPVVAVMMDVAASGGYYLACAADRILAQPTTVTGSIGVIMILPNFTGTMAKLGIGTNVIKSGPMKDAGSPLRLMQPEEREIFQRIIDQMYARFLEVVRAGRPGLSEARIRELADGRVYLGPEALELGLIDGLGSIEDAVNAAKSAADLADKPCVWVQYDRAWGWRPNAYAQPTGAPAQVNLIHVELPEWMRADGPQFLYLWMPGAGE